MVKCITDYIVVKAPSEDPFGVKAIGGVDYNDDYGDDDDDDFNDFGSDEDSYEQKGLKDAVTGVNYGGFDEDCYGDEDNVD